MTNYLQVSFVEDNIEDSFCTSSMRFSPQFTVFNPPNPPPIHAKSSSPKVTGASDFAAPRRWNTQTDDTCLETPGGSGH